MAKWFLFPVNWFPGLAGQCVIFPAGARVLPAGNIEELTGNLPQNPRRNVEFFTKVKLIKE